MFVKRFHEFVINRKTAAEIAPCRRASLCVDQIIIDDFRCPFPYCVHEDIQTTLNTYSQLYPNKQGEIAMMLAGNILPKQGE